MDAAIIASALALAHQWAIERCGPCTAGVRPGAASRGSYAHGKKIAADIFAIGDIVGQSMLAHKAVHEAHVAAEVITGELQGNKELAAAAFNACVIPCVA